MAATLHLAHLRRRDVYPVGTRFGKLEVNGAPFTRGIGRKTRLFFPCRCDCGIETAIRKDRLSSGTASCGCGQPEAVAAAQTTHGESRTRLHNTWANIKQRCHNPEVPKYQDYGGRGIYVCQEWRDSYEAFRDWSLANGYQDHLEIDRKDNDGPYSPENCRWATRKEQTRNTRRTNLRTAFGETKCLTDWANDPRCQVTYAGLSHRIRNGWDFTVALTTPPTPANKRRKKAAAARPRPLLEGMISP